MQRGCSGLHLKKSRAEEWLVHGVLLLFCAWSVFPVLWILSTSFKSRGDVFSTKINLLPPHFTTENYRYLLSFDNGLFLRWLWNSVAVAALTTLVGLFLASTCAYAFSRFQFTGKKMGLELFLLSQMFPGIILIIPLYGLVGSLGLLNTFWALILAYSTQALPFCVFMLKGFFDTIPRELEEAAHVDGLSIWESYYRIVLPLSIPGIAVTAFFSFVTAWNEFMFAFTFMTAQNLYTLPVGLRTFVFEFRTDWHYLSAGAIIVTLPVLIFFLAAQKYLISGLTAGGVKG
jgi:arabinogalactan oligomer/maltooligosaccharide transport system permease protein